MSTSTPWHQVMAEFRGRRLAVHDDLASGVPLVLGDANVQNALGWLVYHRLVVSEADGQLRARSSAEAGELWRRLGPATEAGQVMSQCERAPSPAANPNPAARAPAARAVHRHQAQFFANL